MKMKKFIGFVAMAITAVAWAYLPPVDEKGGVRVAVESFPQKFVKPAPGRPYAKRLHLTHVSAAKTGATSRVFPVTLSNTTAKVISGRLDVWLTDDWTVAGPVGALTLAPGEGRELSFTATSKPCALNGLYPVHARFTPDHGGVDAAAHPIAVFQFLNPRAPRHVTKVVRHNLRPEVSAADRAAYAGRAISAAREALAKGTDAAAGRWRLDAAGVTYGAGVAKGRRGLIDGALAFTDGTRDVVFDGFLASVETAAGGKPVEPRAEIREEKGTLRIRWTIGSKPDAAGLPRIADLALGGASVLPKRLYAGTGNVYQGFKRAFDVRASGGHLSTRHIGVDYANGLSLVQATDVVPDKVLCDVRKSVCSLHAHHDLTFTFVPSAKGCFEAARRFRAVAGYRKSPGHDTLGARMCIDQWEGDFRTAAADLAKAKKYGLGDSFFIKHMWQRWGYDFRLPEIFPPADDPEGFGLMREACRAAGILFLPHDNYTDIYPDADAFSYDRVTFNLDGTPQYAWLNRWFDAQSYRWAPFAIQPWVKRNSRLLARAYDPDGVFIDVLTANCPPDYLDRQGRFYSKNDVSACWGKAFETYRESYGKPGAVCVSEMCMDHLIGTIDAGECDHVSYRRPNLYGDIERVPWHDIVSHGYYVMLAGGVGGRYQARGSWNGGGDADLHGYASDDYFCTCIMGGRNPMSDGPFSRTAVKTFWMQHDACAELGRAQLLDFVFADGDIHRQHALFSDGGEVWINRGEAAWTVPEAGVTLPRDGYYAKTRTTTSGVVVKGGQRCGFAKSPAAFFVDARTPALPTPERPKPRTQAERDYEQEVFLLRGHHVPDRMAPAERDRALGVNRAHRPVDFGGVVTDGSFRFLGGDTIIPLPGSEPFAATIDLAAFGAKGRTVARVEAQDPAAGAVAPKWRQTGDRLTLEVDAKAFAYRLVFGGAKAEPRTDRKGPGEKWTANYRPLDYIRATGAQYVDTLCIPTAKTAVECVIAVDREQDTPYPGVFGTMPGDNHRNPGCFAFFTPYGSTRGDEKAQVGYSRTGCESLARGFPWNTKVKVTCDGRRVVWRRLDNPSRTGSIDNAGCVIDAGKSTMFVFNFNNGSSAAAKGVRADRFCRMRLYSFRITEGNSLRHDFVPCRRIADGAVGLFDRIRGTFHGNCGTGRLLAPGESSNWLTANPGAKPVAYDPMIFGTFVEHFHRQVYGGVYDPGSKFADEDGFRTDVIAALREIKTPIVRWPGGCFASAYHWQYGVGKTREPVFDKAWNVEEPNTFGTDEFVKWCRKVGCEPYICLNAGTGTPEEMSDWAEYCNATLGRFAKMRAANGHPAPYGIKFWSVGAEQWGGHEIGAKTPEEWGPYVRESAKMLRSVDREIKLFSSATGAERWNAPLIAAAGRHLDYLSLHIYGDPLWANYRPSPYISVVGFASRMERLVNTVRQTIRKSKYAQLEIAIDEWNARGWHHPTLGDFRRPFQFSARDKNDRNATYTMADAVYTACCLNTFLRNGDIVKIACFSPAVNATGCIFTHPNGIVKRTTYHVFHLYTNHLLPRTVASTVEGETIKAGSLTVPTVDAVVTTDENGTRHVIAAVNKAPAAAKTLSIDFASLGLAKPPASVEALILSGDSPDAYNDIGAENRVVPVRTTLPVTAGAVTLPPHAVCVLKF